MNRNIEIKMYDRDGLHKRIVDIYDYIIATKYTEALEKLEELKEELEYLNEEDIVEGGVDVDIYDFIDMRDFWRQ